jgi:hypothetical protein
MLVLSKLGTFLPWIVSGVISAVFPIYAMIVGLICSLFPVSKLKQGFLLEWGSFLFFFIGTINAYIVGNSWLIQFLSLFMSLFFVAAAGISLLIGQPFTFEKDAHGEGIHPKRQTIRPKIMAMANCGYPGQTHFEVLKVLFRRIARNRETDLIGEIYRDQGPLLMRDDPQLEPIIAQYKLRLQTAGREVVRELSISEKTKRELEEELIPHDLYLQKHNEIFHQLASI